MQKGTFYGVDRSKEISLYEYGILVRQINKTDYEVIYGVDNDGNSYTSFNTSIKSNEEIKGMINESWFDKEGFLNYLGATEEEWQVFDISTKLLDLMLYYGTANVFSTGYGIYTARQIAFKTKIAAPTK